MRVQRCTNSECLRPYQVNEFDGEKSGSKQFGRIVCPHCAQTEASSSNSMVLVHALSPEEEAAFNLANPYLSG